jgi:integrase
MVKSDDPRARYQREHERLDDMGAPDAGPIKELLRALDPEDHTANHVVDGEQETLAVSSLTSYGRALRLLSGETDDPLLETTTDKFNEIFDWWGDELSGQTVKQRQSALMKFLRYHPNPTADPRGIVLVNVDTSSSLDPDSVLTGDEIDALRDACSNDRDHCLVDLLAYTGQRIRAIQTLRVKDVDPDAGASGKYWLNDEVEGLKGADKTATTRPLLGAQKAVREWLRAHPTGEPDDYLLTALPSATAPGGLTPGGTLDRSSIHVRLSRIADDADVDKDVNPHAFRHFFVTTCKRDYGLEDSEIKHLIGHGPDSRVMETTYSHLSDNEVARNVEEKVGYDVEKDDSALTPPTCLTCNEPLPGSAKACPSCGAVYTPDAKASQDEMQDDVKDSYKQTDPEDTEMQEKIDTLDDLLDDPKVKAALLEELGEE